MIGAGLTVRRARAVALALEGPHLVACNFLEGSTAALSPAGLGVLAAAEEWCTPDALRRSLGPGVEPGRLSAEVDSLLTARLLLAAGSEEAERDAEYERDWRWGLATGLYHFGSRNQPYMPPEAVGDFLSVQMAATPPVELHESNAGHRPTIDLPPPDGASPALDLMRRRRSHRGFDESVAITLDALRDCLFAGLGITGFARVPFEPHELPLKMTPSGGGRNPYEGYVLARHVENLPRGVYHYSGAENSLGRTGWDELPAFHELLGGQTWMDGAAALLLLVADLRRTMRKYAFPTAYRVVLVEAGHIAQNILLAATERGLASVPTCALDDAAIERLCTLDGLSRAVVYAVALGPPGQPSAVDLRDIRPNPRTR